MEPPVISTEESWSHFEELDDESNAVERLVSSTTVPEASNTSQLLPPQLHPAVSLGMKRMSSCYFSVPGSSEASNSVADLLSLWEAEEQELLQQEAPDQWPSAADDNSNTLLYHDILVHVFTFLDAPSLAAFSETARRPNFECFYFLQLQLQRALPLSPNNTEATHNPEASMTTSFGGVDRMMRLAALDRRQAEDTVQEFLNSNTTLKTMPLSHSLAYMRHVLLSTPMISTMSTSTTTTTHPQAMAAAAALLVTVVGAASYLAGSGGEAFLMEGVGGSSAAAAAAASMELSTLFKVGFVGSLMTGAAKMNMSTSSVPGASQTTSNSSNMRQGAESMAKALQEASRQLQKMRGFPLRLWEDSSLRARAARQSTAATPATTTWTPNPYYHLPAEEDDDEASDVPRRMPSGCVGAYSRAISKASAAATALTKAARKATFDALPEDQRRVVATTLIDACCSDDTFDIVVDLVSIRGMVDVDAFAVGSDGTETCALHAAALNGACRVLDFLCRGLSEGRATGPDGGLAAVHTKDTNGWTALHFAAGANCVEAVRILQQAGADTTIEAANGYTPLQWALRLQHADVAQVLADNRNNRRQQQQTLTAASRFFFSLIPSH